MGIVTVNPKKWDIPKKQLNTFDKKEIENILYAFNQSCGGNYYMLDYSQQKIIVDDLSSAVLCGYSKEVIEKDGFDFFKRILSPAEQQWLDKVNLAGWKVLFLYEEVKRKDLVISYDLTIKTVHGLKNILHHKITPFKLCNNGNMWLGLCHVTISPHKEMKNKAYITNTVDGRRYNFEKDDFVLSKIEILTNREKQVLILMSQDLTITEMSKNLHVSEPVLNRIKRKIFDKLEVEKATSAIHKAHLEGLI